MKTLSRFFILLALTSGWLTAQSQQAKKSTQKIPLKLVDQYFAAGEYYTAAHLYEQYLNPSKPQKQPVDFPLNVKGKRTAASTGVSRSDVLFKQAESYRLANYWQEAANAYKQFSEKAPGRRNDALYWYAVCERSLGHYSSASDILKQYLETSDVNQEQKESANKELQTLEFIQQQMSRADSVLFTTKKLDIANSNEKGAFAPAHVSGNQFLISSTEADPVKVNGANPYHSRLFSATLNNNRLESLTPLAIAGDVFVNQGAATTSANGKYLYFSQWKKEKGQTVSAIYYSVKQDSGWSKPVGVSSINTEGSNSKQPFCSSDGKLLFFASD